MKRPHLIDLLCERQRSLGETDAEYAARFSVDREIWRRIRVGKDEPSERTWRKIALAFPDLRNAVADLLLGANESIPTAPPPCAAPPRRPAEVEA